VTAVRGGTELGRTTALAEQVKPPPTPLQRRSAALARAMVAIGLVVTAVVAAGMALRDEPLREAFLVAVSVAIAAVPEGLTATVSVALALGVRAMARRGAIVRTLTAIETIGATTVICSDKTGTLTENRLRLTGTVPVAGGDERSVLEAALLAADPWLPGRDGSAPVSGDPLVRALHEGAAERGVAPTALPAGRSVVATVPFDSVARLSAALYDEGGERRAFVLGAPETILVRSTLGEAARAALADEAAALGRRGMRVLAAAGRRHVPGDDLAEALATLQLEPIGLVAFADPLRPAAREAVERARGAGIHVRMLTGDQASTALAIGAELGLDPASVHARMTPADKLTLVGALQDAGGVVAVTGDGVNDAPALRRADVGIAMGRSGTEVAREAADVVLTDDDFATIVAAVEAGRRISDNVRAAVAFLLSANLGEVLLVLVAVLAGLGAPLTVVQLLTVNLLTDGFPALALARDRSAQDSMRRPPVPATTLFGGALGGVLAVGSVLVGIAGLGAFLAGRSDGAATGQTMAFATIALAELLFAFSCRVPSGPLWRAPRNGALIGAAMLSLGVVAAVVLAEPLHEPFGTIRLSASQALLVAVLALVPTAGTEAAKLLSARRAAARAPALARRPAEREQTRARRR
jgi:Ca2+-transporting ATPase